MTTPGQPESLPPVGAGSATGAKDNEASLLASDSPFSESERKIFKTVAALIVPASAEHAVPGADDSAIFANCLASARDASVPIRSALEFAIREVSDWQDHASITQALEGQVVMAPLVSLVLQCYYSDDRVMRAIGMEPRAPFPQGYSVPEGDWSMLEEVHKRGKIWRDA